MNDDDISILARLTVHEFLLEQLWANLILRDPDPARTLQTIRRQLKEFPHTSFPASVDEQMVKTYSDEVEKLDSHFWDKVQKRVVEGPRG